MQLRAGYSVNHTNKYNHYAGKGSAGKNISLSLTKMRRQCPTPNARRATSTTLYDGKNVFLNEVPAPCIAMSPLAKAPFQLIFQNRLWNLPEIFWNY
jgi:hypothetical protein